MRQEVLADKLKSILHSKKELQPDFSLRKMAQTLGLSPSELSEFINKKRKISRAKAESIISKLEIPPYKKSEFHHATFSPKTRQPSTELSEEIFAFISDPNYFNFLNLIRTKDFKFDLDWISRRLRINSFTARQVIGRLGRLGLIEFKEGMLNRTVTAINTTDDVENEALKKHHLKDMDIAKERLMEIPVSQRDFSSFTFLVDPELLPRAKEIIRRAQDDLEALMEEGNPTEVYKCANYLYPVSFPVESVPSLEH